MPTAATEENFSIKPDDAAKRRADGSTRKKSLCRTPRHDKRKAIWQGNGRQGNRHVVFTSPAVHSPVSSPRGLGALLCTIPASLLILLSSEGPRSRATVLSISWRLSSPLTFTNYPGLEAGPVLVIIRGVGNKDPARVAELADALDSKSSVLYGRVGSSPTSGTLLPNDLRRFAVSRFFVALHPGVTMV